MAKSILQKEFLYPLTGNHFDINDKGPPLPQISKNKLPHRLVRYPIPRPIFPMSDGTSETPKLSMSPKENKRRTGLVGIKMGMLKNDLLKGMTTIWDSFGARKPATIIHAIENQVINTRFHNGKWRALVGAQNNTRKNLIPSLFFFFKRWRVTPKKALTEFEIDHDACIPSGVELNAAHFVPGQFVDVQGISRGKGFQGAMKRWGFKGGNASHGNSKNHRTLGSTGQSTTPGRVHKGKKMAGNMGNKKCTSQNLKVLKIDPHNNLIFVAGHVPGSSGCHVNIKDARLKLLTGRCFPPESNVPFPTYFDDPSLLPREMLPPLPAESEALLDPFLKQRGELPK